MILTVDGQQYEIVNWDTFARQFLFKVGQLIVNNIQEEAIRMQLFDTGRFIRGIEAEVVDSETVIITCDAPYAEFLEYGTLDFGRQYGDDSWPSRMYPKKKNLSRSEARQFPRGMQPFAPFRRVIYNGKKMEGIVNRAAKPGLPASPPTTAFGIKKRQIIRKAKKIRRKYNRIARPLRKIARAI